MPKMIRVTSGRYAGLFGTWDERAHESILHVRVPEEWNVEDRWHELKADLFEFEIVGHDERAH